jgi:hypothetical protein
MHAAFSAAAEATPIRENSPAFGVSLYLQSRDLHFGLQVRVGSSCLPVGAARTFCSRPKLTAKIQGRNSTPGLLVCARRWKTHALQAHGSIVGCADCANNREQRSGYQGTAFKKQENAGATFPVFRRIGNRGFQVGERFASNPFGGPAGTRPPDLQEGLPARATRPVDPPQADGLNANPVAARR